MDTSWDEIRRRRFTKKQIAAQDAWVATEIAKRPTAAARRAREGSPGTALTVLARNLRRHREERGLSQGQLAALAGVSSVGMIEGGFRKSPRTTTVEAIAKALNVEVSELYRNDDAPSRGGIRLFATVLREGDAFVAQSQGSTVDEAVANLREAIALHEKEHPPRQGWAAAAAAIGAAGGDEWTWEEK